MLSMRSMRVQHVTIRFREVEGCVALFKGMVLGGGEKVYDEVIGNGNIRGSGSQKNRSVSVSAAPLSRSPRYLSKFFCSSLLSS